MSTRESTALTRELGEELKRLRQAAGMMGHELAKKLQWSASKVSRIETGQRASNEIDIVWYLAHCGVEKHVIDELLPLCRNADRGFWLKERLPSLIFHETTASVISAYEPIVVPGLLQTEAYARALIDQQSLGIPDRVAAVRIRLRRQQILHDEFRPPQCTFYVHEQALRLPVGGNRVMNEQLLQLVLLADRPNIVIRVVPISAGARGALGGQFMLFQYNLHQPLVYQENGVTGLFVEELEYVQRYQGQLSRIGWAAMDAEESRMLLAAMASEYDRLDGDHDAPDDLAEEQLQQ